MNYPITLRFGVLLVLVLACGPSSGQVVSTPTPSAAASPTPTVPAARGYAGMVSASSGSGVLLFGGFSPHPETGVWLPDLWSYRKGAGWGRLSPEQSAPPPGDGFSYRNKTSSAVFLDGDGLTWRFDSASRRWQRHAVNGGPALHGIHMVYDSESDRFIVFSGDNFRSIFDKTYAYDEEANAWAEMKPKAVPPGRTFYAIAYDSKADRIVLFGGSTDSGNLNDTWTYDLNHDAWLQMKPRQAPSAREYSAMVYDSVRDRLLLFGGAGVGEAPLGDLWSFDLNKNTWIELNPAGDRPAARGWHVMGFDSQEGVAVLFGGGPDRDSYNNEIWTYDVQSNAWSRG